MPRPAALLLLASSALALPSCMLTKPLVCAVTGPVFVFSDFDGLGEFGSALPYGDPCGALAGLGALVFLTGPIAGLVNGAINDWYLITGQVDFAECGRNIENPFATIKDA